MCENGCKLFRSGKVEEKIMSEEMLIGFVRTYVFIYAPVRTYIYTTVATHV